MGSSRGDVKWRACDVGEAKEGLDDVLWRWWSDEKVGEWAELISNRSVASPTSQLILQPFRRFTNWTRMGHDESGTYSFSRTCHNHSWA